METNSTSLTLETNSTSLTLENRTSSPGKSPYDILLELYEQNNNTCCHHLRVYSQRQNAWFQKEFPIPALITLYGTLCSTGATLNLLIIVSVLLVKRLQSLRNYFIVNLAVSDLLMCTVTAPTTLYISLNLVWPYGRLSCRILASMQCLNTFVSCLTLVVIAKDRFLLILCPTKWGFQKATPIIVLTLVWVVAAGVAAPYFFAVGVDVLPFTIWHMPNISVVLDYCGMEKPAVCMENWQGLPVSRTAYTISALAIQYICPVSLLVFAYCNIGAQLQRRVTSNPSRTQDRGRRRAQEARHRNAMLLLTALVIVYAVCWLPVNLYQTLFTVGMFNFEQRIYIWLHLIGMTSACLNPVMYGMLNENFRSVFKQKWNLLISKVPFLHWCCLCGSEATQETFTTQLQKPSRSEFQTSPCRDGYLLTLNDANSVHNNNTVSLRRNNKVDSKLENGASSAESPGALKPLRQNNHVPIKDGDIIRCSVSSGSSPASIEQDSACLAEEFV